MKDLKRAEKARSEVKRWLASNPSDRSLRGLEEALRRKLEWFSLLLEEIEAHRNGNNR